MKKKNLYERNLITYIQADSHGQNKLRVWLRYYANRFFMHNIYLKYIEIPITTKCTLNCKECCNLIQYYQAPYHISANDIIRDVRNLSSVAKGILQLRLLGGEPFLHPNLARIVRRILKFDNIKSIQIATNGTLLLDENMLKLLRGNKRVSIDISNYEEMSVNRVKLIEQLETNHINYFTQKERRFWTAQADFSYRNRTEGQLKTVLSRCSMDCISMLNGKIHLCPRSSHGMDLGIIPDQFTDYCDLRKNKTIKECRKKLYELLNATSISACNYCDVFQWQKLPEVIAAEQISKKDTKVILEKFLS
ncbi:MAG: radical SAM protein [Lachnospiraceae bacterium]|nr:radical SAM protein [Lachnospiraceae bacterium]